MLQFVSGSLPVSASGLWATGWQGWQGWQWAKPTPGNSPEAGRSAAGGHWLGGTAWNVSCSFVRHMAIHMEAQQFKEPWITCWVSLTTWSFFLYLQTLKPELPSVYRRVESPLFLSPSWFMPRESVPLWLRECFLKFFSEQEGICLCPAASRC